MNKLGSTTLQGDVDYSKSIIEVSYDSLVLDASSKKISSIYEGKISQGEIYNEGGKMMSSGEHRSKSFNPLSILSNYIYLIVGVVVLIIIVSIAIKASSKKNTKNKDYLHHPSLMKNKFIIFFQLPVYRLSIIIYVIL